MKKLKNIFYKVMLVILFIFVAYVSFCSIFNIHKPAENLKPMVIILGTIVLICVFINIKKILSKIPESKANIIAICLCIIFFIGLSIFGSSITSIPTYDLSNIQREVMLMLDNGGKFVSEGYFAKYINQIPVTILIYYIYKIGEFFKCDNLRIFATIINSLFISITAFFTYLSVKRLKDYKSALISIIFFIVNPIFYLYSSYFYTDTLALPFAVIAIYLFIVSIQCTNRKKSIILLIFSGILFALGFEIRVVIGIVFLGILIGMWLNNKLNKSTIVNIITLFLGVVVGIVLYTYIGNSFNIPQNKELEFPVTHYLMYGLNVESNGKWNFEDYMYTYNSEGYSKKVENNLEKIKSRINDLGVSGFIKLIKSKLGVNWSNGDYDYIAKLLNTEEINNLYSYVAGNKKIFILYYCQICKSTILLVVLFAIIKEYRNFNKKHAYIYISIFGAFIFYVFWEVLSRYSLTFLPIMIMIFGVGISQVENLLNVKEIECKFYNKNCKKFELHEITKCIYIGIVICTLLLLIINYHEYTIKERLRWDVRVIQYTEEGNFIPQISKKTIKQTFKAKRRFNCISIKFKTENIINEINCKFILKNQKNEVLVEQQFTSSNVKNDELKTFYFAEIKPKGNEQYTIEITSDNATESNSIGVATFYQDGYTAYIGGDLFIDGKRTDADLVFQVQNETIRPYTSKKVYITLSIIILALEVFAFYPYIRRKK